MNSKPMESDTKDHPALARQSSVYSLTFEEFQNSLGSRGKDFGSMNMDEFLKSIWSAEENQLPNQVLQRQGSLTLPETMSRKTVDEVWQDMFRDGSSGGCRDVRFTMPPAMRQRQPTFGEVTLEEFLLKAGVTWEDSLKNSCPGGNQVGTSSLADIGPSTGGPMVNYTGDLMGGWQGLRNGGMMGTAESTVSSGLILGMSDIGRSVEDSPGSNGPSDGFGNSDGNVVERGLRRKGNGIVEKVVERRQRRMIKNRESAARSRARKQAYTLELEAEIAKLKKQNEELLKKQVEILERQKKQDQEQKKAEMQHQPKKPRLRRTNSWPRLTE